MKKIILITLLLSCFNLLQSDEPLYYIDGFSEENLPLFNLMMKDIYNKQNSLSVQNETITKTITTTLTTILAQDVQTDGINNLNSNNVQDNLNEIDTEKLSRFAHPVLYRTMLGDLILGGSLASGVNLGIGTDETPSYPLQIDRQAPQIVIRNSSSAYPFTISVPESNQPKSFVIGSLGVQDELEIETIDNRIYLSRPIVFGLKTTKSIGRYISDDEPNYEIDVSTKVNMAGGLNVSNYTTMSSFTASGYGVVNATFTVGGMIYCSSITPTGTVDGYDVSGEFYNLKIATGTLDTAKLDKSSATATYVFKSGDTMTGDLDMSSYTIVNITSMTISDQFVIRSSTPIINTKPSFKITDYLGNELLRLHSDHPYNVFLGKEAGLNNQADNYPTGNYYGIDNTFVGDQAGHDNSIGSANSVYGSGAGYHLTTGRGNTFSGLSAGAGITTGMWNTYNGYCAGYVTNGSSNIIVGANSKINGNGSGHILIGNNLVNLLENNYLNIGNLIYGTSIFNTADADVGSSNGGSVGIGQLPGGAKLNVRETGVTNNKYILRLSTGTIDEDVAEPTLFKDGYILAVTTTGTVAIGNIAPTTKLDIAGDIRCSSMTNNGYFNQNSSMAVTGLATLSSATFSGNVDFNNTTKIKVYRNGTQTLVANTFNQIQFNAVSNDILNEFNTISSSVVIKNTGWYFIGTQVESSVILTGEGLSAIININGTTVRTANGLATSGINVSASPSGIFYLNANDRIDVQVYLTAAANRTILGTQKNTCLEMYKIP